jgi:anti-sigma regulatory factor (Ser/Thr protein kinase)
MAAATPTTIRVDAGVASLAAVRAFVREQLAGVAADGETTDDFVQAVDELAFHIRDDAPPFDPTTVPEPPLHLPLSQRKLGGMGIHLARSLTDGFSHRILPSGGNEVTVRKRRRTAEGDD